MNIKGLPLLLDIQDREEKIIMSIELARNNEFSGQGLLKGRGLLFTFDLPCHLNVTTRTSNFNRPYKTDSSRKTELNYTFLDAKGAPPPRYPGNNNSCSRFSRKSSTSILGFIRSDEECLRCFREHRQTLIAEKLGGLLFHYTSTTSRDPFCFFKHSIHGLWIILDGPCVCSPLGIERGPFGLAKGLKCILFLRDAS